MKKAIKIICISIIFIITTLSYVNAAEGQSMELSLRTNNESYKAGDEIHIDIYIDQINGFSGINTFTAKKVYDNEILEYIGADVISSDWEVVGDYTNIVLRKMSGEDLKQGKLCTLKFKVLKAKGTTVKLEEVDACNDDGDVYYEEQNVNSPSIQLGKIGQNGGKTYIGIILITAGILGLITLAAHYIINKKVNN